MKKTMLMALGLLSSQLVVASPVAPPTARGYGGIQIHSSVPKEHEEGLKNDIRYIYRSTHKNVDKNFLQVTGLTEVSGPILHNWLINRVRFVVGEQFDLDSNSTGYRGFKYPQNLISNNFNNNQQNVVTVMSNLGAGLYILGKQQNLLIQMNIDGTKVFLNSPRAGLLQIGEGLFHPKAMLNNDLNSSANTISRLATLFHEARHSDGNGKSLSFGHELCPEGHPLENNYACEKVANGPYSIGAYSMKQLLSNCENCSDLDKMLLQLKIADNLGRVLYPDNKDKIDGFKKSIISHENMIATYKKKRDAAKTPSEKNTISRDIEQHENVIANYRNLIQRLEAESKTAPTGNPNPEGPVRDIPVATSKAIMENSLKGSK